MHLFLVEATNLNSATSKRMCQTATHRPLGMCPTIVITRTILTF